VQSNPEVKRTIRTFAECEPYSQEEPGTASFRWALKKNEVPGLQIGWVRLEGPIHKTPAAHQEWDQVYLVFSGSGTIHVGDKGRHVEGPAVVIIPRDTRHSVELREGEAMEYVFVNQWLRDPV